MNVNAAKVAANKLLNSGLGLTKVQVAGIVGGFEFESHLNPKCKNSINAQGIAQWLGARRDGFKKLYGKSLLEASLEEQLDYVIHELKNSESRALSKIKTASTVQDAAYIADKFYERSEGTSVIVKGKRKAAEEVYNLI